MATQNFTLDNEAIERINAALIYGLQAYGEISRVRNDVEIRKLCGKPVDDDLVPLDVTADACAISVFADAMSYVRIIKNA